MPDLRNEKTNQALKNAFIELLHHKNFDDITVGQLCTQAQIRRATFYTHFSDKYDFFSFFIRETRKEFLNNISNKKTTHDNHGSQSDSYYCNLFYELITFFDEHPNILHHLSNPSARSIVADIFTEEISRNIFTHLQEGNPDHAEKNRSLAAFYSGGILQLIYLWIKEPAMLDLSILEQYV